MPVDRVVAEIGFTAHEPLRKRRSAEITNLLERFFPINRFSLFGPERFPLFQGASTEFNRSGWLAHCGGGIKKVIDYDSMSQDWNELRSIDKGTKSDMSLPKPSLHKLDTLSRFTLRTDNEWTGKIDRFG